MCKNETGYKNLIKMVSAAFVEGFYSKPRIDKELLEKYHEGLICLSACLAGEVPQAILAGDYERAKAAALWYRDLFGEGNYYIELQDHGLEEDNTVLPQLIKLARETGIPMAATNDSHYLRKEDAKMQGILLCIQTGKTIQDADKMEFQTDEFYVKTTDEMYELFSMVPEACENTAKIAEQCNFDFDFGHTKIPYYKAPNGMDNQAFFEKLCWEGLERRYGPNVPQANKDRLDDLITHNLRLVVYLAKKYENSGVPAEDLVSIGTIGLIKAVNTFTPARSIKLATYASRCIGNEILMYLRKSSNRRQEASIDEPLNVDGDGNELLLSDILGSDANAVSQQLEQDAERAVLRSAVAALSARERQIMELRFGLTDGVERTQKEAADALGISQSYISRLEKRIIRTLKARLESE